MPQSKNLTYPARIAVQSENLKNRIKQINADLKHSGILCKLAIRGNSLTIRYTDLTGKSKEISPLGVDKSPSGILTAQNIASKISQAIRLGNYSQKWLDTEIYRKIDKKKTLTCGAVRDEFPNLWLKYRSGDSESTDRQKMVTLDGYIGALDRLYKLAGISDQRIFDGTLITELLDLYPERSDKRFRAKEVLSVVSTLYGITYNFRGIGKRPAPKQRSLPSDSEIILMFDLFITQQGKTTLDNRKFYQWAFGLIATYGLRPQEVFAIDLDKSFKAITSNWLFLNGKLCQGIKTGNRIVPPLLPEWIDLFDLKTPKYMEGNARVDTKANNINKFFNRFGIGCKPYDLRHAYAIRSRKYMSLLDAANAMGHDISTHVKTYQRWISDIDRIESVNQGLRDRAQKNSPSTDEYWKM